jgi:hypothetical protein
LENPRGREEKQQQTYSKEEGMQNLNCNLGKRGQGLVEYILVVFLMAVIAITIVQKLGQTTQKGFTTANTNLSNALTPP